MFLSERESGSHPHAGVRRRCCAALLTDLITGIIYPENRGKYPSEGALNSLLELGMLLSKSATLTLRMYGYTATFWLKLYHILYELLTKS